MRRTSASCSTSGWPRNPPLNELAGNPPLHQGGGRGDTGLATTSSPTWIRRRCWWPTSPTRHKPDDWRLHVYFDRRSRRREKINALDKLAAGRARPRAAGGGRLGDAKPGGAGADPRRAVLRPYPDPSGPGRQARPASRSTPVWPSGPASMTTTAGCLAALDRLEREGRTSTTLPNRYRHRPARLCRARPVAGAKAIATDIDPIASTSPRDNAAINDVPPGHGSGELLLAVADGMEHRRCRGARALRPAHRQHPRRAADRLAPELRGKRSRRAQSSPRRPARHAGDASSPPIGAGPDLVDRGAGEWSVLVLRTRDD